MTLGVLALLLLAVAACALARGVAPVPVSGAVGRALTRQPLPMVLCSWWAEVETRPG